MKGLFTMAQYITNDRIQKSETDYIRHSMSTPMLSKEREQELAIAWKDNGDEKALHEMINAYARLVISAASKFRHYGLPMGDLIQEGNIGLLEAAKRFEPAREFRFSTYATWWIKSCMQDYVLRNWSIVRTGTTAAQKSLFFNFRRLRAKIEGEQEFEGLNDTGRSKIANDLNVRVKDVEVMEQRLSGADSSLNMTISDEGNADEWQSFLEDDRPNPEEIVTEMKDAQTRSKWLNDALSKLNEREQKIIRDRHMQYDVVTLEQLGTQLGISKERVRQLEQRAMEKLKGTLSREIRRPQELFSESL
jgi:RNA polymerase sigma-32 factor